MSADPTPRPSIVPPGLVASAAMARAAGLEEVLGGLAADLGVGRDIVLGRALRAYRKIARRARRAGLSPEAFLADLCRMHDERTLRAEIDSLRATVDLLRAEIESRGARRRGGGGGDDASAAELFRQFRAARSSNSAVRRGAREGRQGGAATGAGAAPHASPPHAGEEAEPAERPANILTIPGFPRDAQRALQSVAAAANAASAPSARAAVGAGIAPAHASVHGQASASAHAPAPEAAPVPDVIFTPVAAPNPTPEGRLDYAERRARVPKVTF